MRAYDSLSTFSDVSLAVSRVAANSKLKAVIFSNGTKAMVYNSVFRSKDLSPHASVFQDIVTMDEIQRYKPSRASYQHLAQRMGKGPSEMKDIWVVSGNPFDIVGSRSVGTKAIWVDRAGKDWKDAVAPDLQPTAIVHSLEHIVEEIVGVAAKI